MGAMGMRIERSVKATIQGDRVSIQEMKQLLVVAQNAGVEDDGQLVFTYHKSDLNDQREHDWMSISVQETGL